MKVFNHGPHIIIDLLTCGAWLPVHLLLWACAPNVPVMPAVPVGAASSSAAAAAGSANTTIIFGGPGPVPQVYQDGQPQVFGQTYPQPVAQPVAQPGAPQPIAPQPIAQAVQAAPPAWAIEEARERLPQDAPWDAVRAVAWEFVQRRNESSAVEPPPYPTTPLELPD